MKTFSKLFKPLGYIMISNQEKRWFDWYLPATLALLGVVGLYFFPVPISLLGKEGVIPLVNGLLQMLSGFYIASMAAVATFQRQGMDAQMEGDSTTLYGKGITRRSFITHLFGYLAFMSIALYFIGGFSVLAREIFADTTVIVKYICVYAYLYVLFNIICTTLLGMHFMIDRIHRVNSTITEND